MDGESHCHDSLRLAAGKRLYETFRKPSLMNTPTLEDVHALVEALDTDMDKLDVRNLSPDKKAHINDGFKMITVQLIANAETLENLMSKLDEFETISDMQKANADTLATSTEDVNVIKSELMTKLDGLNTISEMQKTNAGPLDTFTADVKMMKSELITKLDEFKMMSALQNVNAEQLHNLTKFVSRLALYSSYHEYLKAGYTTSGKYWISIPYTSKPLNVYCDQDTDCGDGLFSSADRMDRLLQGLGGL